jgi:lipid II:glycine glycyltransferase (peptidoglycan interpeptide bridge formation enzyme)
MREIGLDYDVEADALVYSTPESGFMQSSAWAEFKQREGFVSVRYGFFEGEKLRGIAGLFYYPAGGGESVVVCPEGPILPWDDSSESRSCLRQLLAAVESESRFGGTLGLRIEPHLAPPAPSLLRNWSRSPVDLTPIHTLMIELGESDEALLKAMHPKARYNLRLAKRHGVEVTRFTDTADLRAFYSLFEETALRNGVFQEPYGFFLNLCASLFPRGHAELLLARWQGDVIAGLLVLYFGRRATYLYGGSTARHRHVMPNHLLHWTAIHAAREHGCEEYDLYGYEPFGLPDHLYAGISRFKKQLGGRRVDWMGARDHLFYDRLADRMIGRMVESCGSTV